MTRKNYPRLRNGKLEGGGIPLSHIFDEEKKQIWALCTSSLSAMAISKRLKASFPEYEVCLCNRETFLNMGGKI